MKSELSFLLELILDEQTPQPIKQRLVRRVQDVEKNYTAPQVIVPRGASLNRAPVAPVVAAQSPSMQRIMEQNPDLVPAPPVPVTPAAAQALAARQALLNSASKEKPEPGMTGKRKI